jgi:hypothetical protein
MSVGIANGVDQAERPKELKPLDRFVGNWDVVITQIMVGSNSATSKFKGIVQCKWAKTSDSCGNGWREQSPKEMSRSSKLLGPSILGICNKKIYDLEFCSNKRQQF